MISKKLLSIPVLVAVAIFGIAIGSAFMAKAQSVATTTNTPAIVTNSSNSLESAVDTPESVNDPADTDTGVKAHQHAPLGGDGIVASITGSTVVISEESDEGGASYSVDASKATITHNGASASLADIKIGDKVFVKGTVNGTNVIASSISVGSPHEHGSDTDTETKDDGNESQ